MKSTIQKKLAGKIAKRSSKRVRLDPTRLDDIKEAITRQDVRALIKDGAITLVQEKGVSKGRSRYVKSQKSKGRRKGAGSRKGKANARLKGKDKWMARIRLQRFFLKDMKTKGKLTQEVYKDIYKKSKG